MPEHLYLPLHGAAVVSSLARRAVEKASYIAAALIVLVVLVPMPTAVRVGALVAIGPALAIAFAIQAHLRSHELTGWIVVDGEGIARERAGDVTRFTSWGAQFGVAVLSNESRDLGVLAITTKTATRYVPVRVMNDDDRAIARDLFVGPAALTEVDVRHVTRDAAGALSAEDAALVVSVIRARDPSALDRIVLSDPRGALVVLEGDELRAGDRVIDLTSPLEWRAFLFVEATNTVASVVQATWVRQAGVEVVLVADAGRERTHPRGARVSHPDAPPPIELRMAIERLFMAPLRQALDRAPRASRASAPIASAAPRAPT
jgi:hypothetical protein